MLLGEISMANQNVEITYFTNVKSKRIEWLWYPYIPYGKITILQGDPGEGKTSFVLDLIARMSKSDTLPLSNKVIEGRAIYQNSEDDISDTIKPRLTKYKANCKNICFIDTQDNPISIDDDSLEEAITTVGAKLIVLDPLQSYLGSKCDINRAYNIRPKMTKLKEIAARTGCAIVLVGHLNKNSRGKSNYRGLGSIDISAAARSILHIGKLQGDESVRVLSQIKNNLAPLGKSLSFSLGTRGIVWHGEIDISAQEMLEGTDKSTKITEAVEFIRTTLSEGQFKSADLISFAKEMDISKRTLMSAKAVLPIKSIKKGNQWYWELKDEETE